MFKNCKYCKYCKEQKTIYGDIFYICSIDNSQTRLIDTCSNYKMIYT